MSRIYLSPPDVGPLEEAFVLDAIRSGWVAPLGPHVDAFEREMAERIGVPHAVALSSGTAALHLALVGWGVGPGDVVVTSTMTFAATANVIVYTGAEPFFVDCDETGCMDVSLLEEALAQLAEDGRNVPVVLPVDLLGRCADLPAISSIADRYGARVLVDAAESLGSTCAGRPAGALGNAAAFSFNGNKIMTTSGGGMLLSHDGDLIEQARYLSTQARQPVIHYEHADVGYNYRLSNLLAAVGRAQLQRLDAMLARRREIRERYVDFFVDRPGVRVFGSDDDRDDNCWLTAILVDPVIAGWTAQDLWRALDAADVEARPLWKPMHLQPLYEKAPAILNGTSENLFAHGLALPSGSSLNNCQLERVLSTMHIWIRP